MQLHEHVRLAPYTTFRIGGPARWFAEAETEADILSGVDFARERGLPLFVLGGGSNLLVSDQGFPGLVLHIGLRGIVRNDQGIFTVAAGEDWDGFVEQTVAADYAGLECLAGIPGSVGGTPVQNVGAYGQEVSETITSVRALDLHSPDLQRGAFVDLPARACGFSYRSSLFNGAGRGRYIVCSVKFQLASGSKPSISYRDIKHYFQYRESAPTLAEVARAVREIRRAKGMLLVEGDPDCVSAGSFFKNPVIPVALLEKIVERSHAVVPRFDAEPGLVKIPAAWLVEQAGFAKGYTRGRAGISSRHTLALINRGGASAAEVIALRDEITEKVQSQFGIQLEPEPVFLA